VDSRFSKNGGKAKEIVFCGFGEPTMRLEVLKAVAKYIKNQGGITRLNTNGHGSLINKRDIVPELKGLIDTVSVSLNAGSKEEYDRVSVPQIDGAFEATVQFIKRSVEILPRTIATVVRVPGIDIEKARSLAEELGAEFRVRELEE
jgi:TatD DNase family protein